MKRTLNIIYSVLLTLCFTIGTSMAEILPTCPDKLKSEQNEDCPWALITTKATIENKSLKSLLEKDPFWSMLKTDAKNKSYQALWGKSVNFDEFEKQNIIPLPIADELMKIMNLETQKNILHAGVQHTYGYLFSNLKTSFGFKRARWVKNELEDGFGLPKNCLSPRPTQGTFFSNVTYFFSQLTFKEKVDAINVSPELIKFDYKKIKKETLEETIGTVTIKTDIVYYTQKEGALLLYSINNKLITGFPITLDFVKKVFDPRYLGEKQKIKIRYNAWIDSISDKKEEILGARIKK